MLLKLKCLVLLLSVLTLGWVPESSWASSDAQNFMVLGVIASSKNQQGVALIKDLSSSRTFAIKEGDKLSVDVRLAKVFRKHIVVEIASKTYQIEVGGDRSTASELNTPRVNNPTALTAGQPRELQMESGVLKVSQRYKSFLLDAKNLESIIMQVAAVPYVVDGRLQGFHLWEIDKDSIFDIAGFKDGDLITKINDQPISDIAMAIRHLNSLRDAPQAKFNYVRDGMEQNVTVMTQ